MLAYNAGPSNPASNPLVSSTSSASSSISIYFFITSIISFFIISKKSGDTLALSCISTNFNLSFAACLDAGSLSFFCKFLIKFSTGSKNSFISIMTPPIIFYYKTDITYQQKQSSSFARNLRFYQGL